jgi:hypothetical protein
MREAELRLNLSIFLAFLPPGLIGDSNSISEKGPVGACYSEKLNLNMSKSPCDTKINIEYNFTTICD